MTQIADLEALKRKAERLRQERDKAQGRLEQSMQQLKDEFKVETLDEAKKLLKKLKAEAASSEEKFDKAYQDFNEKWGEQLGQGN